MAWITRPRKLPITRWVIHWTGGSWNRTPEQVVAVLARRGLSVHSVLGAAGRWLEAAPPDRVCLHAGPDANENSLGTEVVCPGFGRDPNPEGYLAYRDVIHGRAAWHQQFTPRQMEALVVHAWEAADDYGVPLRFPTEPDGVTLIRTRLPSCRGAWLAPCPLAGPCRRHFAGILGHFHVTGLSETGRPIKRDPGSGPLLELATRLGGTLR